MNPDITSGANKSCWLKNFDLPQYSKLDRDVEADVVIVGGGIAGMTCAYMLVNQGQTIVLLDDGEIGSGETGRTTAHLSNALDDRYYILKKEHGKEGAQLAADSHMSAINLIETICETENIQCEFKRCDGYLFLSPQDDPKILQYEFDAAREAGIDVEFVNNLPLEGWASGPAIKFPRQAQFHPMKYLTKLSESVTKYGGKIYTHTHAVSMKGGHHKAEVVTADGHTVRAKNLIVATNVPVNDKFVLYTKMEPYRTYVITCSIPKGSVPECLLWETSDIYHYIRVTSMDSHYDLLIVGGEDHKSGQAHDFETRYTNLWTWTKERFPMVQEIVDKWSGHIIEPVDSLGYVGRNPADHDNVYIVTGDSGNGLTNGTLSGILISDLIMGRHNAWEKLYSPSRQPIHELTEFLKHNLNVGIQYKEWFTPSEVPDIEDIRPCSGAVIREGLSKVAVYRDENGNVHKRSAVCPHLKAICSWNDSEKSWDCPAHGSRFDPYGRVINGPANCDLSLVGEEEIMPKKEGLGVAEGMSKEEIIKQGEQRVTSEIFDVRR